MFYAANTQTRSDMHIPNALEMESDQEVLRLRKTSVGAIRTQYTIQTTTSESSTRPEGIYTIHLG